MNNNKNDELIGKIGTALAAMVLSAVTYTVGWFRGKIKGHKRGLEEGKNQCNEDLREIITKYSK